MNTVIGNPPYEIVNTIDLGSSDSKPFELRILLCPEAEGGFSVFSVNLPGVMSQGETEAEAIVNIAEASRGALLEYQSSGVEIPWGETEISDIPRGSRELWIVVNV